jgi:quercetin dioxygenase-like cupin family protein
MDGPFSNNLPPFEVSAMYQHIVDKSDCVGLAPFPGVLMSTTEAEKMTLSVVEMEPHSVIDEHSHPHEQIGYMVEGQFEMVIDGVSHQVKAGQMWRLPGGALHKVIAGAKPCRAIDVFYPVREDMRGSD